MTPMPTFIQRNSCPLCSSKHFDSLISLPYTSPNISNFIQQNYPKARLGYFNNAHYTLNQCRHCSFIWQHLAPNPALSNLLYGHWTGNQASLKKKLHAGINLFLSYTRQLTIMHGWLIKPTSQLKLLDFGMGWGFFCRTAQSFGFNVTGLEVSPRRRRFASKFNFSTTAKLPSKSSQFDIINLEQVLEHLNDPLPTLKSLTRLLKPNGVIHLAVPNGRLIKQQVSRPDWSAGKNAAQPLEHLNTFTPQTLKKIARHAGLEPISPVNYLKRQLPTPSHGFPNLLLEVFTLLFQQFTTDQYFYKPTD